MNYILNKKVILFTATLLITLVLAEIAMRNYYKAHFVVSGWNKRSLPKEEVNHFGSRGRKVSFDSKAKKKIILLGDSQVFASTSPLDQMPEALLENSLKHRAVCSSIASGGWGQDQQYLNLKKFFRDYDTDLVVLWFTPYNDIWNNMFPTHYPKNGWAKPTYWLENGVINGPTEQMHELIYATPRIRILEPIKLLIKNPFIFDRDGYFTKKHFPKNEQWTKEVKNRDQVVPFENKLGDINKTEKDFFFKNENLINGKNHWSLWMKPKSERLKYGIILTNKLLKKIQSLCTENDSKLLVFWVDIIPGKNDFPGREIKEPYEYVSVMDKVYKLSNEQYSENMKLIMDKIPSYQITLEMESWWRSLQDNHFNKKANITIINKLANIISN
jgi:hypothetical protein